MSKKRVIIIGSGMGGLSCGVVLAKNGYDVTVLEQSAQIGGCLQCFYRHGQHFETGMHFIGSAGEGQTLDMLLRYLEVRNDIQLSALDTTAYDIVSLGDRRYRFPNGREAFLDQMSSYFPHQRQQLTDYFNLVERVASASTLHSLKHADHDNAINATYQLKSINGVIDSIITDPLLSDVLVGNLPLYAAEKDKTPFSTHAFIMAFYNQNVLSCLYLAVLSEERIELSQKFCGRIFRTLVFVKFKFQLWHRHPPLLLHSNTLHNARYT